MHASQKLKATIQRVKLSTLIRWSIELFLLDLSIPKHQNCKIKLHIAIQLPEKPKVSFKLTIQTLKNGFCNCKSMVLDFGKAFFSDKKLFQDVEKAKCKAKSLFQVQIWQNEMQKVYFGLLDR